MHKSQIFEVHYLFSSNYSYEVADWLELVAMGSDKATKYIVQLYKFNRLCIPTFQRTSLPKKQFKMLKISIYFVLVVVAVLFVTGKHKFKLRGKFNK